MDKKIEHQSEQNALAFSKQEKHLTDVNNSLKILVEAMTTLTSKVDNLESKIDAKIDTKISNNNSNMQKFVIDAIKIASGNNLSNEKLKLINDSFHKNCLNSVPAQNQQVTLQAKATSQQKMSIGNKSSNTS